MRVIVNCSLFVSFLIVGCGMRPLPIDYELHVMKEDVERGVVATLINQQGDQCTVAYEVVDSSGKKQASGKQTIPGNGSLDLTEFLAPGDTVLLSSRIYSPFQLSVPKDKKQIPAIMSAFKAAFDIAQQARGPADERIPGVGGIAAGSIDEAISRLERSLQQLNGTDGWDRNPDNLREAARIESTIESAKAYKAGKR